MALRCFDRLDWLRADRRQPVRRSAKASQQRVAAVSQDKDLCRAGLFGHPAARGSAGRILDVVDRTDNTVE